ncbi:MAG: ATP-binding protein [Bacteroidia bacterium]|nr:ATP-binding protein [Bacteroidia bacterium]
MRPRTFFFSRWLDSLQIYWNQMMNSSRIPVRVPIILGFSLALIAVSAIGFMAYSNLTRLTTELKRANEPSKYLVDLSEVISDVSNAESSVRVYMFTLRNKDLEDYYLGARTFGKKVKNLHLYIEDDTLLAIRTDSLRVHLERKYNTLTKLVEAVGGSGVKTLFGQLADRINDTVIARQPEAAFFKQLFSGDSLNPAYKEEGLQDTLSGSRLIETLAAINKAEAQQQRELRQQILKISAEDQAIMARILSLESRLKYERNRQMLDRSNEAQSKAFEATQFIGVFTVFMLILCLFLLIFIVDYLDRNRLLQIRLEEEKARAEKLAKAKEEFLANMSHEIRTPMNAVIGFAEQLAGTALSGQQNQLLEPIRYSAQYLLALINDILDYSKLDSGNLRLEAIGFRLPELMDELLMTFGRSAREKGIRLVADSGSHLPEVLIGDPLRLRQMLFNLVSNALKFTHAGEVRITATQAPGAAPGTILFTVQDTGIGIAPDKIDRIFSEFMQADSSITRKYGGSGLGLSITQKLARMHGGDVRLTSQPGQGTTATLTVPFRIGRAEDLEITPPDAAQGSYRSLRGLHMILADDEPYNRQLIQVILQKWGVTFEAVENGRQLLDRIKAVPDQFQAVLMDLQMPEMDGMEATRQIRAMGLSLPIVALTATSTQREIAEALEAGMDGHLLKPFREQALYSLLTRLLGAEEPDAQDHPDLPQPPAPELPADRPYNLDELARLANHDTTFMLNLLGMFATRTPEHLRAMVQAQQAQDWDHLSMAAHRLIPQARHLGLHDWVARLKTVELQAQHREKLDELPALVADIVAEGQAILDLLTQDMEALRAR